jgi:hypothetical protein
MMRVKSLQIQVSAAPDPGRLNSNGSSSSSGIWIETDPSGKSNLEFKPAEKPKAEEKKAEGGPLPLIFEEVRWKRSPDLSRRENRKTQP